MQSLGLRRELPVRRLPSPGRVSRRSCARSRARRPGDRSHRNGRRRPAPASDRRRVRCLGLARRHRPRDPRRRLRRRHGLGCAPLVAAAPLRTRRRRRHPVRRLARSAAPGYASRSSPPSSWRARERTTSPAHRSCSSGSAIPLSRSSTPARPSAGAARWSRSIRSQAGSPAPATASSRTRRRCRRTCSTPRSSSSTAARASRPAPCCTSFTSRDATDARLYPGSWSEWYALGPVERVRQTVAASWCARCGEIPCRWARTSSCSPSSSSTSGQQLHVAQADANRQALGERVGAELVGERARERARPLALLVVPELSEHGDVLLAHLDPGAVAEVAVLVRRSAARAARGRSSGRRSRPCSTAKSSSTYARLRRSSSSSRKMGCGRPMRMSRVSPACVSPQTSQVKATTRRSPCPVGTAARPAGSSASRGG